MKNNSQKHMRQARKLADEMIRMAERFGQTCDENGCLVVSGVIKDCGYKIKGAVEREFSQAEYLGNQSK